MDPNIIVRIETQEQLRTICQWHLSISGLLTFHVVFPDMGREVSVSDILRYELVTSSIPGYASINKDSGCITVSSGAFLPDVMDFDDWLLLFD